MIRVMRPPARLSAHPSRAGVPPWELAALLLLLALCVALRVARLGALPIFVDESLYTRATQIVATGPVPGTLLVMASPSYGGNPPLFSWLAAPLTRLILDPLLATRLASALIGTLGMLGTWAVGRALWGPAAALLAGLFYTLCPYLLFYNRLALLDGLVATCGAWTLLFAITLSRRGRVRDAAALGLCLAAALLTKILAVDLLLLPLLAIATAPCGRRSRAARGAALAVALGVLPFLVVLSMPYDNTPAAFALHGHLQTGGGAARLVHTLQSQAGVWETALWLYLTPPILLLGVLGLWAARRDRAARLVGLWAVLGSLPIVLVPNRLFVPRHFLYIAVPILLLAARGALELAAVTRAYRPRRAPLWPLWPVVVGLVVGLAAGPAVGADTAMIAAPARTPLIPADSFQYVRGWPSGYMLAPVIAYLRRQAADGPVTIVAEDANPPLYMLRIAFYRDPRITVTQGSFDTARALHAVLRTIVPAGQLHTTYLIAHHSSDRARPADGPGLLSRQDLLRLVLHVPSLDHASSYDVYAVGRYCSSRGWTSSPTPTTCSSSAWSSPSSSRSGASRR